MVPRQNATVVLLLLAAFIPSAQRLVIGGADFNFVRLLVLVGLVRLVIRSELRWVKPNSIDCCVAFGALARIACAPLARGTSADLIAAIGSNFELVGSYTILRSTVRGIADVRHLARGAAFTALIVVPFFLVERYTGRNGFAMFGGIPEITNIREGRIRCRGAFSHAILAGCFFVAWLPIWIALFMSGGRDRWIGTLGAVCGAVIVFCCASSTPTVALILGLLVWMAFPLRAWLRPLYLSALGCGFILHFLMTQPIWHLIARIDLVGGSTGIHRFRLIDAAIKRFSEWWFAGTPSTAHWGWGLQDVTNQFVLEAVRGGVWALVAMVAVFVLGYACVGSELRRLAKRKFAAQRIRANASFRQHSRDELLVFGIGAALFAQMAIFLAVSYFGQSMIVWQFFMAIAGSMRQWTLHPTFDKHKYEVTQSKAVVESVHRCHDRLRVSPLPVLPRRWP
jgi:hypothetical protein